jgi:hypothetical protein
MYQVWQVQDTDYYVEFVNQVPFGLLIISWLKDTLGRTPPSTSQ